MPSNRQRAAALCVACCMLLSVFTSCGKSDKKNFVMRTLSTFGSESDSRIYSDIISEYTKSHKNVTINDISTDAANSYKMELSLSSTYKGIGTPDVIYYSAISDMSELSDFFMTIDDIRRDYPKFASTVSEPVLDSVSSNDGKRYCIPVRGEWAGIVVNAALFRQSGLEVPETWKDIVKAAYQFKDKRSYLFANSLEDSSSLLEYMVRSIGGSESLNSAINGSPDSAWSDALETIIRLDELGAFPPMYSAAFDKLVSSSDLKNTSTEENPAQSAINLYNSGHAAIMLINNTLCTQIDAELDNKYIMLPNVDVSIDAFSFTTSSTESTTSTTAEIPTSTGYRTTIRNTLPFNLSDGNNKKSGGALTEAPKSNTSTAAQTTTSTAPTTKPSSTTHNSYNSKSENGLYVNYSEGFYITKKAYYNDDKREDILDFIECFLKEENVIKLCSDNQVPSLAKISKETITQLNQKSGIYTAVINSVQNADSFVVTTHTNNNKFFWNHCEMAVSYMSKGILTKEQALAMIADTQMSVADAFAS